MRLKPHVDFPSNALTNIQFTIKWPANSVNLIDFVSGIWNNTTGTNSDCSTTPLMPFLLQQQLILLTGSPKRNIPFLSFSHDQTSEGLADIKIDTSDWAVINNGFYHVELLGLDYTGIGLSQCRRLLYGALWDCGY